MHPLNRPYQQETYQRIINSTAKYVILSAPVGSGKSAFAGQSFEDGYRTLALVKTKSLQDQYFKSYEFTVLKGKNSYTCGDWPGYSAEDCLDCQHRIKQSGRCVQCKIEAGDCNQSSREYKCKDCHHDKTQTGIESCDCCGDNFCDYPVAYNRFMASNKGCLNYTKYLVDKSLREYDPDIAFLDEAHQLEDIVLDFAGITWQWANKRLMEYCEPIELDSNLLPQNISLHRVRVWLKDLQMELADRPKSKPYSLKDIEARRAYKWWEETSRKVETTIAMIDSQPDCWFVHSDNERITIKPLTARFHFPGMFNTVANKIVLMSATIPGAKIIGTYPDGLCRLDCSLYAKSLGLVDYEAFKVPNAFPGPMRPVYDLHGPRLGWKSTPEEKAEHIKLIADKLNELPEHWTGLIHVTSKKMARDLADNLRRLTGRMIWLPTEGDGTEKMLESWVEFAKYEEGAIGVSWAFHEGIDTGWLNINITAKVPFTDFSDAFEKARFDYDRSMGLARVANVIEQQQGRNRRGYPEHYGGKAEKYNAIVDGRWNQVKNYLSDDFLGSIIG